MTPGQHFPLALGLAALLMGANAPVGAPPALPPPAPGAKGGARGVVGLTVGVTGSCPYGLVA
jgi:hypothetical protein